MEEAMAITGGKGYGFVFETAGQVPTMHMAFELAGNKSHVCFIGTPHVNLEFTPAMWENMNRKEFKLTGSWMSYSALLCDRTAEIRQRIYLQNGSDESGTGSIPDV